MKKDKDKELDDLFKNGLADPGSEAGYREEDWDAFEQMLDKPKKRPGIIFWLPILSSAAALLLFFGWWFFKPQVIKHNEHQQVGANTGSAQINRSITGEAAKGPANKKQQAL